MMSKRLSALAVGLFVALTTTAQAAVLNQPPGSLPSQPPAVPLPEVQVPVLPLPDVKLPEVPLPVRVPGAPEVESSAPLPLAPESAPVAGVLQAVVPPAGQAGDRNGGSSAVSRRPGTASGGSRSQVPPSASPLGDGDGGAGVHGGEGPETVTRRAGGPANAREAARTARSERRLHEAVRRLRPCLSILGPIPTRVLVLRAGLGRRRAMPRPAVARVLDRPIRRVRKIERRALRRLREARRAGQCSEPDVHNRAAPDGAGVLTTPGAVPGGTAGVAAIHATAVHTAGGSGASRDGGDRGGVLGKGEQRGRTPFAGVIPRPDEPVDITLPLLIGLAASGAWLVARRMRRGASD